MALYFKQRFIVYTVIQIYDFKKNGSNYTIMLYS